MCDIIIIWYSMWQRVIILYSMWQRVIILYSMWQRYYDQSHAEVDYYSLSHESLLSVTWIITLCHMNYYSLSHELLLCVSSCTMSLLSGTNRVWHLSLAGHHTPYCTQHTAICYVLTIICRCTGRLVKQGADYVKNAAKRDVYDEFRLAIIRWNAWPNEWQ